MGLPQINIEFEAKAQSVMIRSERGVVAVILKDDSETAEKFKIYTSLAEVDFSKMSEANYGYMKLIFEGSPYKAIAVTISSEETVADALKTLKNYKWNYLTVPSCDKEMSTIISSFIKEQRSNKKRFKAVLPDTAADEQGIINFTTKNIVSTIVEGKTLTTAEYCCRIAGIVAGLSLERSATYYELSDLVSCDIIDDPDKAIDDGELIIVFDGEKYKLARGVNSCTSTTRDDLKKIKIIEGMDLFNDDVKSVFEDSYIGKVANSYDNKQLLVAAILEYIETLKGTVLDPDGENECSVSMSKNKAYLELMGTDTSEMDETAILRANTGSHVFLEGKLRYLDAMEDLDFHIEV